MQIIPNGFCGCKWECVYDNYVTDADVATDFLTDGYVIFMPSNSGSIARWLRARNMLDGQYGIGAHIKENKDPVSIEVIGHGNFAPYIVIGEGVYSLKVY